MASWTPEHLAPSTLPNTKIPWTTIEEERQYREEFAEAHLQLLLGQLLPLLQKLERISDPRRPGLLEAPHAVFPELEIKAAPHMDTVNRLLEGIEPEQLEEALRDRIRSLLRHHKLQGFLVRNHHVIAIDGTQKLSRDWCWAQEAQHWQRGGEVHDTAYVLEALLVSEFPFGVCDRGMSGGLVKVRDDAERGEAYAAYLRVALAHPACIGAHWFRWGDEPVTGRFDGEDDNLGLVDVTDVPYAGLVAGMRRMHGALYKLRFGHTHTSA